MSYENENGFGPDGSLVLNNTNNFELNIPDKGEFDALNDVKDLSEELPDAEDIDIVSEQHPEPQEEHFESPVHKHTKRESGKTRINQLTREKYQALDALERLQSKYSHLENMNNLSTQAAMKSYDESVKHRLENATRSKAEAIESGDVNAQVKADLELHMAASEYKKLEDWKVEENVRLQGSNENNGPNITQAEREYSMQNWFNSRDFYNDPALNRPEVLSELQNFTNQFDYNIHSKGYQNYIGSPEYLEIVDAKVNELREWSMNNTGRGSLNMRSPRQPVASARSGNYQSSPSQSQGRARVSLDSEERAMAKRLNVSEKQFALKKVLMEKEDQWRKGR